MPASSQPKPRSHHTCPPEVLCVCNPSWEMHVPGNHCTFRLSQRLMTGGAHLSLNWKPGVQPDPANPNQGWPAASWAWKSRFVFARPWDFELVHYRKIHSYIACRLMYKLLDLSLKVKKILLPHLSWSSFTTAWAANLLTLSQVCICHSTLGPSSLSHCISFKAEL